MISRQVTGRKSQRESEISPPSQRVIKHSVPGGLIYDPNSGSLRYPKPPQFSQLSNTKSVKVVGRVSYPLHGTTETGSIVTEKDIALRGAHGGHFDQGSGTNPSEEASPRCVIRSSTLDSSNSTSPTGSKAVSEMDDYSDVKQLIVHNRSSSPSDADDDSFYGSLPEHKGLPASGFCSLDPSQGPKADAVHRQKTIKGNGELAQKIYQVTGLHSRSISVPGADSFHNLGKESGAQLQLRTLEKESLQGYEKTALSSTDGALVDSNVGGGQPATKEKTRPGANSVRSSHELLSCKENGWAAEQDLGQSLAQSAPTRHQCNDSDLDKLARTSVGEGGQIILYRHHNQKPEEGRRKNGLSNSQKANVLSTNILNGGPTSFSFNQSHVVRGTDTDSLDYDNNYDNASSSSFDFNRGDLKGMHRTVLSNLTKPAPSKWDDAEKWLSSASETTVKTKSKSGPLQSHLVANQGALFLSKRAALLNQAGRVIPTLTQLAKPNTLCLESVSAGEMAVNVNDEEDGMPLQQPMRNAVERTKKVDTMRCVTSNHPIEGSHQRFTFMTVEGVPTSKGRCSVGSLDRYPLEDLFGRDAGDAKEVSTSPDDTSLSKPALRTEKPTSDSASKEDVPAKLEIAKPEVPSSPRESDSFVSPVNNARPVCMRDMGTEMTPIASVEPSRTATPVCATTPTMRSPMQSRPTTPNRGNNLTTTPASESQKKGDNEGKSHHQYTDKELQAKTRQEILALGTQLGKHNIAAWATKEEEEEDAFKSLKSNVDLEEVKKNVLAARAAAWEEAEQAKYVARYNREEAKIQAWENHEKAKAEAEMRRIEVKVERMRSHANEKLLNKIAAARRHSEELRAAAAARRGEQASKTAERAEYIRRTGNVPGSMFAGLCCW